MKVRIEQPARVNVELLPGDELHLGGPRPGIEQLLLAQRLDGEHLARVIDDEEIADAVQPPSEKATTDRGQRRGGRTATVPE